MESPKISIVIVHFNDGHGFETTMKSVIDQNYTDLELIVVDGESNDGSLTTINTFSTILDVLISEPDAGIYDAMNKGMAAASGDLLCFLNAGDTFHDSQVLLNVTQNELQADIIFGQSLSYFGSFQKLRFPDFELSNPEWFLTKMPNHQAIFISDKIYKNHRFSLKYKVISDTIFLRFIFSNYSHQFLPIIISRFELGGISNYYGTFKNYWSVAKEYEVLYQDRLMPIKHFVKYFLQKVLSKELYHRIYVKYLLK